MPQRLIFFLELPAQHHELFEPLLEASQLEVEAVIGLIEGHFDRIEPASLTVNNGDAGDSMRMHSTPASNVTHEPGTTPLDYDTLRDALVEAGAVMSLAELHGGVAGGLCAGGEAAAASWLEACLRDQELEVEAELDAALKDIVTVTARALGEHEFAFEPLLPDDDAPLEEQVSALALWCHGFVTALGANAPELTARSHGAAGPVDEVFRDFAEIGRAGLSEAEAAGEDQPDFALAELREYVRAGVQIVFEELASRRAAARDMH